ncbi:uncharacterized protein METZ01_LOCUS290756, partial [marine metagenome]
RVKLVNANHEAITDEFVQSFYVTNGLTQHIYEDFENPDVPTGWAVSSNGEGWYITDDGGIQAWEVETGVGNYAIANDDAGNNDGESDFNDGSVDYMVMPVQNFNAFGGPVALEFGSYFDGSWNQDAYIEYSLDGGTSWIEHRQIGGGDQWERQYVDLTQLAGQESVLLAFHTSDNGGWGAGWAVDDVTIVDAYDGTRFDNTSSIVLDGQDDYIEISADPGFTIENQDLTIAAWIESPNDADVLQSIFQGWYGFGYQLSLANGVVNAVFREPDGNGVGTQGSTDLRSTGWRYVAVTLNASDVRVYVDGQLDGQGQFNVVPSGNGEDNLTIGNSPWAETENFSGTVDEVAVWNRVLGRDDIENNMYYGTEVYSDESLIAYWNFNSGGGDVANDMSGNGH